MASRPTATRRLTLPLMTGLTALLAACGGGGTPPAPQPQPQPNPTPAPQPNPTPPPTATEVAGRIPGQITPFKAGAAGSVKPDELAVSAPVNATGVFDLGLPKVAAMTSTNASLLFSVPDVFGACTNPQTSAPPTLKVYPINDLNTDKGQSLISEIDPAKAALNYRAWWFATQDATVKFRGDCLGLGKIDTTFALKRGWNLLVTVTDPGVSTSYTAGSQPGSPVPWRPSNTLSAAGLDTAPNVLRPWRNLPEYRDR